MIYTKFTKGPWVITDMGTLIQKGANEHHPIEVAGLNIAHFSDYGDKNHRKANAHLISAAPDLYEELEQALDSLKFARDELEDIIPYEDTEMFFSRIELATTTLAKARGKSQ